MMDSQKIFNASDGSSGSFWSAGVYLLKMDATYAKRQNALLILMVGDITRAR